MHVKSSPLRHPKSVAVGATLALLTVAGCGSDSGNHSESAALSTNDVATATSVAPRPAADGRADTATTSPATTEPAGDDVPIMFPGVLEPDTWRTNRFAMPLMFELGVPWRGFESPGSWVLTEETDSDVLEGELAILLIGADRSVDELVGELQATEGITFSEPVPASILGRDGVVMTAPPTTQNVAFGFLFDPTIEQPWVAIPDVQHEVFVVDRDGTALVAWLDAPPDRWEAFRDEAHAIIDSIVERA